MKAYRKSNIRTSFISNMDVNYEKLSYELCKFKLYVKTRWDIIKYIKMYITRPKNFMLDFIEW